LGLRQLLLRSLQREHGFATFGNVARDFRVPEQYTVLVSNGIEHDACPEGRAVLANAPALGLVLSLAGCNVERPRRQIGRAVLLGEKAAKVLPDDLVMAVSFDALRPGIPAGNYSVGSSM